MIKTDKPLVQWDLNRVVEITTDETFNEVHFYNSNCPKALVVKPFDNNTKANIPNILLQEALPIVVWLVHSDESGDRSLDCDTLVVSPRKMPDDYVYEETEVITFKKLTKDVKEAVKRANDISADLEEKRDSGYFNGRDGVDGKDGIDGKDGTNGVDGVNGKSAYEHAKDGGYIGSEETFAESLAHVAELEAYKANSIISKASGVALAITDSAKIKPQSIKTYGKSKKRTLVGTNLVDVTKEPSYNTNDSFIVSDDGYRIETTKKVGDTVNYPRTQIDVDNSLTQYLVGKTIYLMADNMTASFPNDMALVELMCIMDDNTKRYFNLRLSRLTQLCPIPANTVSMQVLIYTNNTDTPLTTDNTVVVEGLRLTLEANAPWEPYVGSVASPSIAYPQEVESLGESGSIVGNVRTLQLLDISQFEQKTSNGVSCLREGDYIVLKGTCSSAYHHTDFSCFIKAGTTVYLYVLEGDASNIVFGYRDVNNAYLIQGTSSDLGVAKTLSADCHYFRIILTNASYDTKLKLLLTTVQNAPYQPFSEQSFTLQTPNSLRGIPLGATVPDAIKNSPIHMSGVYHDGEQYWIADTKNENGKDVQRVYRKIFDGTESMSKVTGTEGVILFRLYNDRLTYPPIIPNKLNIYNYFSNFYKGVHVSHRKNGTVTNTGNGIIDFMDDRFSEIKDFKEELKRLYDGGTPVYVDYILAEPIVTDTSDEEKAQLDTLVMNYPNTTIVNDANAHMDVEYVADTKSYVDQKIASAIANMQALILEN